MSEVKSYRVLLVIDDNPLNSVWTQVYRSADFDRVTAERDAALKSLDSADASAQTLHEVVSRLRSERDAALLELYEIKESLAYLGILLCRVEGQRDAALGREADLVERQAELREGITKHWQVVCDQRAKIDALQQRLTAADERVDALEGLLAARESELEELSIEMTLAISDSQIRSAMTVIGRTRFLQLLQAYNARIDAALRPAEVARCTNCDRATVEQCDDAGCGFLGAGNGAPY